MSSVSWRTGEEGTGIGSRRQRCCARQLPCVRVGHRDGGYGTGLSPVSRSMQGQFSPLHMPPSLNGSFANTDGLIRTMKGIKYMYFLLPTSWETRCLRGNRVAFLYFAPCFFGRIWRSGEVAKEPSGGKSMRLLVLSLPRSSLLSLWMTHDLVGGEGLLSCWEKRRCASHRLGTPSPNHKGSSVTLAGKKVDLGSGPGSWPRAGQQGSTRGTRHWVARPMASLLARGSVHWVTLCLEKELREQPWACCVERKHTQIERL